ncbi:MAG: hypothetical protein O2845_02800 [Proteobacteria bacterium]|nr:hypothetical protein [Pseudomonadota bacterium]
MIDIDNPPLVLAGVTLVALLVPVLYNFIVDRYAPNLYKKKK